MTETQALPPPEPPPPDLPPSQDASASADPTRRWGYLAGFLVVVGLVALGVAVAYLWRRPNESIDPAEFAALRQQVESIGQRVTRLEQRPAPAPAADLRPLEARVVALEHRPAPPPPTDIAPLEARVAALEQKPAPELVTRADLINIATRVDAIATRQDQLANRQQGLESGFGNRMDRIGEQLTGVQQQTAQLEPLPGRLNALDTRLVTTEKQAGQVASVADRAARIARIQAAQAALEAGQPVGAIPDAPPALAKFATARPPTEAELRLSFPEAARAAEKASQPSPDGKTWIDRVWIRAQDLVSLREGDRVILGDPASGVIARARQALVAGDLRGAVAVLDTLTGPAAAAIAGWKGQAQSLLDARLALAGMAAHA